MATDTTLMASTLLCLKGYDPAMPEALISVRVTPRSSLDELAGWQDEVLRIRLKAPPIEGRANEALCRFLASKLAIPATNVEIISGATARTKRLRIMGLSAEAVRARLG